MKYIFNQFRSQHFFPKILYFLFGIVVLILLLEGGYWWLNKRISPSAPLTLSENLPSPTVPTLKYETFDKNNLSLYFHKITPQYLPDYPKFKNLYEALYSSPRDFLLNKERQNNFFVNGQGYYYYQGIPVKLMGIYEGYYFENEEHFVLVGVLSKENEYKYFKIKLLSPQETVIGFWGLAEDKDIHGVYKNEDEKYTLADDLKQKRFLEVGIPVSLFIETDRPNISTVMVVFSQDKFSEEKFKDLKL